MISVCLPEAWITTTAVTPTTRGCPGATPLTAKPAGSTAQCRPVEMDPDQVLWWSWRSTTARDSGKKARKGWSQKKRTNYDALLVFDVTRAEWKNQIWPYFSLQTMPWSPQMRKTVMREMGQVTVASHQRLSAAKDVKPGAPWPPTLMTKLHRSTPMREWKTAI